MRMQLANASLNSLNWYCSVFSLLNAADTTLTLQFPPPNLLVIIPNLSEGQPTVRERNLDQWVL